jgi:hypothetical protein
MNSPIPAGALVDPNTGEASAGMKAWMQAVQRSLGGSVWDIRVERVSNTQVNIRLLGDDKVWRAGSVTLS